MSEPRATLLHGVESISSKEDNAASADSIAFVRHFGNVNISSENRFFMQIEPVITATMRRIWPAMASAFVFSMAAAAGGYRLVRWIQMRLKLLFSANCPTVDNLHRAFFSERLLLAVPLTSLSRLSFCINWTQSPLLSSVSFCILAAPLWHPLWTGCPLLSQTQRWRERLWH